MQGLKYLIGQMQLISDEFHNPNANLKVKILRLGYDQFLETMQFYYCQIVCLAWWWLRHPVILRKIFLLFDDRWPVWFNLSDPSPINFQNAVHIKRYKYEPYDHSGEIHYSNLASFSYHHHIVGKSESILFLRADNNIFFVYFNWNSTNVWEKV